MAVNYYYPSPAINVGKGFLGEYLTGFVGQRKEDHKNLIARKLKALDPSKLIELENQTLKNIGALQEQIARIAREGYAAEARYRIADRKARGAERVQIIAAQSRMSRGQQKLVSDIYKTIYETYDRNVKDNEPDSADMRDMTTMFPAAGTRATGSGYISGIDAAHSKARAKEKKKEWLVIKALQIAKSRGHKTAYSAIVSKYGSKYRSIGEADPWQAFLGANPDLDPRGLAEGILREHHRATPQMREIIRKEILGDVDRMGGMPTPPTGGIQMLRGYLAQERAELADVRTQRKEMQSEYYKTALSSYMTPWLAPSYTKAPEWEADFERAGVIGAQDRTAFDHFMMRAKDPENQNWRGSPDPKKIYAESLAEHDTIPTAGALMEGDTGSMPGEQGGVRSPLGAAYTHPGTKAGLEELRADVEEYKRFRRGSQGSSAKLMQIYLKVKGSLPMPDRVKDQIQELEEKLIAAREVGSAKLLALQGELAAEQKKRRPSEKKTLALQKAIKEHPITALEGAIKTLDQPRYKFGQTGAAIQASIESATSTGEYGTVHNDFLVAVQQGTDSYAHMERVGQEPWVQPAVPGQPDPSAQWPYRAVNRADLAALEEMGSGGLNAWYSGQKKALAGLDPSIQKDALARQRILGLMKYVYDPGDKAGNDLLRKKLAEKKVAELEAEKKAVVLPPFSKQEGANRAAIVSRRDLAKERMEGLREVNPGTNVLGPPAKTSRFYRPYLRAFAEHERLSGELAKTEESKRAWLQAQGQFESKIEGARAALNAIRPQSPIPSEDVTGPYTAGGYMWTPQVRRERQERFKPGPGWGQWRSRIPGYTGLGLPQGAIEVNLTNEDVAELNKIARDMTLIPGAALELKDLYRSQREAQEFLKKRAGSATSPQYEQARATLAKVGPQIQATIERLAEKDVGVRDLKRRQDDILSAAEARGMPEDPTGEEFIYGAGEDLPEGL